MSYFPRLVQLKTCLVKGLDIRENKKAFRFSNRQIRYLIGTFFLFGVLLCYFYNADDIDSDMVLRKAAILSRKTDFVKYRNSLENDYEIHFPLVEPKTLSNLKANTKKKHRLNAR